MATTEFYTSAEVAVMIRRNQQTVLRYAREKKLGSTRPGGRYYLFSRAHIDAFLAEYETPGPMPTTPKPSRHPKYTR
jgi:excisionase family DNA binding protein